MGAGTSIHGMWSTRIAFILAASGSAVGLGNVWRFPYTVGEYGGGAFVLVYLLCVAMIGIPIMMAEIMLGRRGRQSPINTMKALALAEGKSSAWQLLGWMGILSGFLILSFYSVIGGWTMAYVFRSAAGVFTGINGEQAADIFKSLVGDPERLLAWHTIFMVMVVVVVARGVSNGLESAVRYLMPALFILLVVMVVYAMTTGDVGKAMTYLFAPDFHKLADHAGEAVLSAMGQAFFSLSLGMGAIMIYGSYLNRQASIATNTIIVAGMDTLVAILAGMAIFPIVFENHLDPTSGPGLIFQTLPIAFGEIPGGGFFGMIFFILLVFAAWTSAISLLEPITAWLVENQQFTRVRAAMLAGVSTWLLGILCLLSLNVWSNVTIFGKGFLDLFDFLTANILLPLGGVLIAVFAGWMMSKASSRDELQMRVSWTYFLWLVLIRFVAPVAVTIVLLNALGVLKLFGLG